MSRFRTPNRVHSAPEGRPSLLRGKGRRFVATAAVGSLVTAGLFATSALGPHGASAATTRDPITWPFPWSSIWNMPIGSGAIYDPAGIAPATGASLDADENVLVLHPEAPSAPVYQTTAGWDASTTRCAAATSNVLFNAPIPQNFFTDPGYGGSTPNMASAVLLADGHTVKQSQPLHRCADGRTVSQYVYPDADIRTGDGIAGAHGGSGMSSLGGTIRMGELVPDGTIRHALKLELFAHRFLAYRNDGTPGFRWPAVQADGYAFSNYAGSVPSLEMGALLALKPDFSVASLRTEPARILARALQDYGGYVVDDTAWDVDAVATEWGPDGRVTSEFNSRWGFPMSSTTVSTCTSASAECQWAKDIGDLFSNLNVVANNGPGSVGGPGTRRTTCAPAFADGTGGAPAGCDGAAGSSTTIPGATPTAPAASGRTVKIMPLGDSLTAGDGATGAQSYRGHLYARLSSAGYKVDFVGSQSSPTAAGGDPDNEGHGGFTLGPDDSKYCTRAANGTLTCDPASWNISDNVGSWLGSAQPDVVLLLAGINDMFPQDVAAGQTGIRRTMNPADAAGKLSALVTKMRTLAPNAKIVIGSLLPVAWTTGWTEYDAVNAMAASLGSASPSDNVFFADLHATSLQAVDFADQIHLTNAGAAKVASAWMSVLPTVLGSASTPGTPTSTPSVPPLPAPNVPAVTTTLYPTVHAIVLTPPASTSTPAPAPTMPTPSPIVGAAPLAPPGAVALTPVAAEAPTTLAPSPTTVKAAPGGFSIPSTSPSVTSTPVTNPDTIPPAPEPTTVAPPTVAPATTRPSRLALAAPTTVPKRGGVNRARTNLGTSPKTVGMAATFKMTGTTGTTKTLVAKAVEKGVSTNATARATDADASSMLAWSTPSSKYTTSAK